MFTKPNKKNVQQYENDYKKAFFIFFKLLTSETKVDEAKRKFILECFERFKDNEEYESTKDFVLEVFEEIGFEPFQKKDQPVTEKVMEKESTTAVTDSSDTKINTTSEISVPMKIDLQQMYLLQLFQRALALNISIGTSNKRIFGFKIPFLNDYAFFIKTLCLGTLMVRYKRDGKKCIPEVIQLNSFPKGWRIDDEKKPLDGITIFDFYQSDFKMKICFMEKRIMKEIKPILFGSKKCDMN
ncbi:hypothetical protein RclHR1_05130005 [Rhizophagus clarus]|uniref:Uncharacterized protein n=1 Tax=Rhizophagus clarus TaxID=94130 RepID=A0A2Z6RRC1_9GLOM|nr:hypothetical protein RclHR1_05130005 [Rhizophagus clarus]GES81331.1 hypothetical protein GLOIN_2v1724691 [Rhizophagus clarus]